MTLRAIAGLGGLNVLVLAAGAAGLWGLGAVRRWVDFVRLAGVAYLLGLASLMVVLTVELVVGVPIGAASGVATLVGLGAVGLVVGWGRRQPLPARRESSSLLPPLTLLAALSAAGVAVYFAALFRSARLSSMLGEWDGWWFWVPKAKAIYHFGGLDPELLAFVPNTSYPPGLPAFHALAFHAMGSPDDVTLHLQYWVYAAGFVAALAGLLATRVRQNILLPLLLPILLTPSLVTRGTSTYADLPLGYLVAVAAVLLFLWLHERLNWQLVVATLLLSGAAVTKREGLLLAACVVLAGMAASWATRRSAWPRLVGCGAVVLALALPWNLWRAARGLSADIPDAGPLAGISYGERIGPAVRLAATTLVDSEFWLLVPTVAAVAVALAIAVRFWPGAIYTGVYTGASLAVVAWLIGSVPTLPFSQEDAVNPVVRLTGTSTLVLAALTPLLLEHAWRASAATTGGAWGAIGSALDRRSRAAWLIVLAAVLAFPVSMAVGYSGMTLPGGAPRFPATSDCVARPTGEARVRVVLGYASSYPEADDMRQRAQSAGLPATQVAQDGCGRLRVFVDDVATTTAGPLLDIARRAGFDPSVEQDPA